MGGHNPHTCTGCGGHFKAWNGTTGPDGKWRCWSCAAPNVTPLNNEGYTPEVVMQHVMSRNPRAMVVMSIVGNQPHLDCSHMEVAELAWLGMLIQMYVQEQLKE